MLKDRFKIMVEALVSESLVSGTRDFNKLVAKAGFNFQRHTGTLKVTEINTILEQSNYKTILLSTLFYPKKTWV